MTVLFSTINGREDKNDDMLKELLEAGNWKQALALIDKRLKKGEKSSKLAVNRISVLLSSREQERWKQALLELHTLLSQKPFVTDIRILTTIEALTAEWPEWGLDAQSMTDSMWERAASLKPKDGQLIDLWFRTKFVNMRYKAAQKAAMVYSKNFPDNRRPYFWAILASHLASQSQQVSDTERSMFKDLAYRLLEKAAAFAKVENPISDLDTLSLNSPKPVITKASTDTYRALKNPGDLLLLVEVYKSQGREQEALAVLKSPHFGLESPIGQSSWELMREKVLLNEVCELWNEQFADCYGLLHDASPSCENRTDSAYNRGIGTFGNDWLVWKALLKASSKIRTAEISLKTKSLINSFILSKRIVMRRNARLALIEYYAAKPLPTDIGPRDLLSALLAYQNEHGTSPICFAGVRRAHCLSKPQQQEFLVEVTRYANTKTETEGDPEAARAAWVAAEINSLKQDYTLVVSLHGNASNTSLLKAFIATCLRLYNISRPLGRDVPISERRPGDDAAILAAAACIRLFDHGETRAILRCAAILELLLQDSTHNYDAQLMAIRVYIYLGLTMHAVMHYSKLDIKNIQFLTNSWILLTRISTIHPHACPVPLVGGIPGVVNLAQLLKKAIKWGERNNAQVVGGISRFLELDSLSSLLQHLEYYKRTELTPLVRYSMICEIHRIIRLGHGQWEDLHILEDISNVDASDVRNKSSFPNYEAYGQASFEEYLQSGPTPQRTWLTAQIRYIKLTQALSGIYMPAHAYMSETYVDGPDMTRQERAAAQWTSHMLTMHTAALRCDETMKDNFILVMTATLMHLKQNLKVWTGVAESLSQDPSQIAFGLPCGLSIPWWQYFHVIYTALDQCSLTTIWLLHISLENQVTRFFPDQRLYEEKVVEMKSITTELYKNFHIAATKMHADLSRPRHVGELAELIFGNAGDKEDVVGQAMRSVIPNEQWMTDYSTTLLEDWQEALTGVLRTKVRNPLDPVV